MKDEEVDRGSHIRRALVLFLFFFLFLNLKLLIMPFS